MTETDDAHADTPAGPHAGIPAGVPAGVPTGAPAGAPAGVPQEWWGIALLLIWVGMWGIVENTINIFVPEDSYGKRIGVYVIVTIVAVVLHLLRII